MWANLSKIRSKPSQVRQWDLAELHNSWPKKGSQYPLFLPGTITHFWGDNLHFLWYHINCCQKNIWHKYILLQKNIWDKSIEYNYRVLWKIRHHKSIFFIHSCLTAWYLGMTPCKWDLLTLSLCIHWVHAWSLSLIARHSKCNQIS